MSKIGHSILLLLIISSSISAVFAQNKLKIATPISHFEIATEEFLGYDTFGFCYSIKNNVLSKTKAKEHFEYTNITLGKISKVDLINPLKIVVFYENFNNVILLDNQLNKINDINLSLNNTTIVATAVGMSTQNQLWVFNTLNQQLGLYDYLNDGYKTIATPLTDPFKYYQTDFNNFYWIDAKNNWYSCDLFGKIKFLGIVPEYDQIEIINDKEIIFKKANLLYFKDMGKAAKESESEIHILENSFIKFWYKDQILSIFTPREITNYKIITP